MDLIWVTGQQFVDGGRRLGRGKGTWACGKEKAEPGS